MTSLACCPSFAISCRCLKVLIHVDNRTIMSAAMTHIRLTTTTKYDLSDRGRDIRKDHTSKQIAQFVAGSNIVEHAYAVIDALLLVADPAWGEQR